MRTASWVVISCLVLSGCASSVQTTSHRPGAVAGTNVASHAPVAGTVAANRALATAEAQRLLSRAVLPPGSVPGPGSAALSGPVMGTEQSSSLIDESRNYQAALPLAQALSWLQKHPPLGLAAGGSSSGTDHGVVSSGGYSYGAPDSDAWTGAQLEIGVVSLGTDRSTIRVDGLDLWLDPTPVRDDQAGPRLRVEIATGCPATDGPAIGVTNAAAQDRDLDAHLLPAAKPNSGLVCVYNQARTLTSHQLLDAAGAQRTAGPWQRLSLSHIDNTVTKCPADIGTVTIYVFGYPTRPDVDLWDFTSGCSSIANGQTFGYLVG
jgi:hypothetical protein